MNERESTQGPGEVLNKKIGDLLLELGHITVEQLEEALEYQRNKSGRIGWILVTLGYINRMKLFQAITAQNGLELRTDIDRLAEEVDIALLSLLKLGEVIEYQTLPYRWEGKKLSVLTSYPNNERALSFIKAKFSAGEIRQIVITDLDLTKLAETLYRKTALSDSVYGFFYRNPEESAYSVFTLNQLVFIGFVSFIILAWVYYDVLSLLIMSLLFVQLFYTITVGFKLFLSIAGIRSEIVEPITEEEINTLKEEELPVYSVLVPVYKEPEVIGILMDSLKKLDYPQNKLDIILLLEDDDKQTLDAAKKNSPPGNWRFIIVPDCQPRTKPKACNYGLFFARGKYLVIYDAEDIPDPDQLKKAFAAFRKCGSDYVCFQAALNYFNKNENFLTKMFTLEYSAWFDYMLPGLDRFKFPIPLGGTSNHFDIEKLRMLGGWDPFNTTEDADLGIRASAKKYKVGIINTTTYEEANSEINNWIRQRSRWLKGYMQTWLVYSRHPVKLIRAIGIKGWLSFNLFIGGSPFSSLINPITWSIFVIWILTKTKVMDPVFPPEVLYLSIFNLLFGNFLGIYLSLLAVFKRKYFFLIPHVFLIPFYWALYSIAAYKALWQLFTRPFYWEKTQHGITKHVIT